MKIIICDSYVCVINSATKYLNAKFKEDKYFVDEVETLIQEKNHFGAAKLRKSTIQKTKLVTRQ
jgi:hypothetical protein